MTTVSTCFERGDVEYFISVGNDYTFSQAQSFCDVEDGTLAFVTTDKQLAFIKEFVAEERAEKSCFVGKMASI